MNTQTASSTKYCVIESGCDCDGVESNNCIFFDTLEAAYEAAESMNEMSDGLRYNVCTAAEAFEVGYTEPTPYHFDLFDYKGGTRMFITSGEAVVLTGNTRDMGLNGDLQFEVIYTDGTKGFHHPDDLLA